MDNPDSTLPRSEHFTLEVLADGVYAALAIPQRGARSNAGIVDLGDGALVFDTMLTPQAAIDLRNAAERLTGGPVRYVVNSHRHLDHVMGNAVFPAEAQVISTARTRQLLLKHGPESIRTQRQMRPQSELELREMQDQLAAEDDPARREALHEAIQTSTLMLEAVARWKLRAPNWTFEKNLAVYGSRRAAEVICLGGGHTESDAILVVPEAGVAFVADLLFQGQHPWAGDGHLAEWRRILGEIEALDLRAIVPGHGPLAGPADLGAMRDYLTMLEDQVAALVAAGGGLEEGATPIVPEPYQALGGPDRFTRGVRVLAERAISAQKPEPKKSNGQAST